MSTFSSANITQKNIITKPYLLTSDEISQIGNNINFVGYDFLKTLPSPIDETIVNFKYGNPSSPRLLNWVEPYNISGIEYTLFYSEVNSGLKVNDKVFIINGAYDSNSKIQENKYKKGRDGYKVLFVDECRIVLDIEFVGWLPANENSDNQELFDDFIKVYCISDQNDFIHVNRQITTRNSTFDYKFNQHQNNIIFTKNNFNPVTEWGENLGLIGAPGFFIKNGVNQWINITNDFLTGSYSIAAATNSNNKIIILNNSFTFSNYQFNEDSVYSWEYNSILGTSSWTINVKHENNNPPIITKSNFRNGQFDGQWNGGVYGTSEKRIFWNSLTSKWNSGTLLNTIWQTGIIDSFYSQPTSYFSEFDYSLITNNTPYGLPYQKINNPDNNGYGYNFIINSDIQNAVINNGNVTNSLLGGSASSYNIVEEYLKGNSVENNFGTANGLTVNKALFDNCKFLNANIENTEIRNSRSENSRFNKVKSVNSHYKSSLFLNSNYISDNIIKVLGYDEFTYSYNNLGKTHKVYKFYINKRSYEKFKLKDTFYIKGIKINDNSASILNFFDTKFKIGPWTEYVDFDSMNGDGFKKYSINYNAFVSTPKENQYKYSLNSLYINELYDSIDKDYYSVDLFISSKYNENNLVFAQDFNNTFLQEGILDFSEAYIVNSDFESGVFESSNWNSGNHINFSNDNNITKDINNGGGLYDIFITGTNSLLIENKVSTNLIASEVETDYFESNSIIFLNSVDYDTRGKVTSFSVFDSGTLYDSQVIGPNGLTTSSQNGTGLTIDIQSNVIGGVNGLTFSINTNSDYNLGVSPNNIRTVSGGSGIGMEVDISINMSSNISSILISNTGIGYQIGDILEISHFDNEPVLFSQTFSVTSILNGEVLGSSSIIETGLGYQIGDIVSLNGGNNDAKIIITGVTGSLIRLPDSYKVVSRNIASENQSINIQSLTDFPILLPDGIFLTEGAQNKYNYIHKTKFNKSRLIRGIFKRAYVTNSLIKDEFYNVGDRDFRDVTKIKNLILSDNIFSNNSNIFSKALYMNSSFVGGSDIWDNGILYESIWNGGNFRNGLVKESVWVDGIFSDGLFYNSRSFNNDLINNFNQNVKTRHYKKGTIENTRFSWQNGIFNNGEFYKSDWESGIFNNGKFYYSKFYSGIFNNGTIGDTTIAMENTWFYNGTINYTTVYNSTLVSEKYNGISYSVINWNDGIFNSGVFGTNDTQSFTNSSIWEKGIFNGGEFKDSAKWKNGTFNGGKFISNYNFIGGSSSVDNNSSLTLKEEYSWEYGIFNGGEFGNANTATNSTWFDGEFNGGQFKGRVWNNGIFSFGEFFGSGNIAIGGTPSVLSQSNPNIFVQSYNGSPKLYYGLWRDGYVTDTKDKYITDRKLYTNLKRSSDTTIVLNRAILKNMLWLGGTFSHPSGEIRNSVWLDGSFENGLFKSSSFNPYILRFDNTKSFNFSNNCHWKNGMFDGGEFNISTWDNGTFLSGTATGMIWKNGVTNYMNAYNVFWENGLWRNGNWNGSYFNLTATGSVVDNYDLQVIHNGMSFSATSSVHVWNVFYDESLSDFTLFNTTEWGGFVAGTGDNPPTIPMTFSEVSSIAPTTNNPVIVWDDSVTFYSLITIEFTEELTVGQQVGFDVTNSPLFGVPTTYSIIENIVTTRIMSYQMTAAVAPTSIVGEATAINYYDAISTDLSSYTVTRSGNVVSIRVDNSVFGSIDFSVNGLFAPYTNPLSVIFTTNNQVPNFTLSNSNDRTGTDTSITTRLTNLLDLGSSSEWQVSTDNINWSFVSSIITNTTNTYNLSPGDNYFRIETTITSGLSIDIIRSNTLKYTK